MEHIQDLLKSTEHLKPIPTEASVFVNKIPGLKAFIFDIYGTLLISASGDIDQANFSTGNLKFALEVSGIKINTNPRLSEGDILSLVLDNFKNGIRNFHLDCKKNNIPYPEVDVLEIWQDVIKHARVHNLVEHNGQVDLKQLTMAFELLSNKVYPMPGMHKLITTLYKKNMPMGIVSNAQFYTPIVLNYFINKRLYDTEQVDFFDRDLTVFSYKKMKAKPDKSLFEQLVPVLKEKYGIKPEEVIFVGNDMYKDVYPASLLGFKTALFAGDKRSLRWREDKPELKNVKPDIIVTELPQLLNILD